jgi:hypothetical protein
MRAVIRWGAALLGALAVLVMAAPAAGAAAVSLELFVLIPHQHQLAVYQQVNISHPTGVTTVNVLAGYRDLRAINVRAAAVSGDSVTVIGDVPELALRYVIPWNGTSKLATVAMNASTTAVVVMVPTKTLTLPNVLNAIWEPLNARKIPGLPDSPTFSVWATGKVRAGQSIAFSVERVGGAEAGLPSTFQPQGFPTVAALLTLLLALVLLVVALLVVNWKPTHPAVSPVRREELMGQLAQLEAHYRQGGVEDAVYERQRGEMLAELCTLWEA